jgi:outer membrane protein assembly factor BamB
MTSVHAAVAPSARPLRLWPGVTLAALLLILKVIAPVVAPQSTPMGVLAGPVVGLLIVIWWTVFSRAPQVERWGGLIVLLAALLATSRFLHVSIATGMMGYLFPVYAIPMAAIGLVGAAVLTRRMALGPRRLIMAAAIVTACGAFAFLRTGGFSGYIDHDFAWRWSQTAEERLLAQAADEPAPPPKTAPAPVPLAAAPPESIGAPAVSSITRGSTTPAAAVAWPGFRGPARDGVVSGVTIATDWTATPPSQLWRRAIGPGWSSFAVRGEVIYTQEQRGDEEVVAAYSLASGKPVWRHHDTARFWESNGGAGPRATPTIDGSRVYALGATGLLNALDADTGAVLWSANAAADTGAKVPEWGFSGSPIVIDGLVVAAAGGILAAYDAASGERRWVGPDDAEGYTSPQVMTIDGIRQIVLLSGTGLTAVSPQDGKPLWQHAWKGYPIVQPAQMPDGGILIAVNESSGVRRLAVSRSASGWRVEERWTSSGLKPWFNDFVVHKGHAYGFDGTILSCIDLTDGARKWKGGRYGGGQLILLPQQDLLVVISEDGELAMVNATPDGFKELGRVPALSGKTWNHPVLVRDVMLVRNGEERVVEQRAGHAGSHQLAPRQRSRDPLAGDAGPHESAAGSRRGGAGARGPRRLGTAPPRSTASGWSMGRRGVDPVLVVEHVHARVVGRSRDRSVARESPRCPRPGPRTGHLGP